MAKLTKKQNKALSRILTNLERGIDFLMREDVRVAKVTEWPLPIDYIRESDQTALRTINKEAGSLLCMFPNVRDDLERFIEDNVA